VAEPLFSRSLHVHRELVARYRSDPYRYTLLAAASTSYGEFLIRQNRSTDEDWALVRERMELCERARNEPHWPFIVDSLNFPHQVLALDRIGRHDDADRALAYGLKVWRELSTRRPILPHAAAKYGIWLELARNRPQASDATVATP